MRENNLTENNNKKLSKQKESSRITSFFDRFGTRGEAKNAVNQYYQTLVQTGDKNIAKKQLEIPDKKDRISSELKNSIMKTSVIAILSLSSVVGGVQRVSANEVNPIIKTHENIESSINTHERNEMVVFGIIDQAVSEGEAITVSGYGPNKGRNVFSAIMAGKKISAQNASLAKEYFRTIKGTNLETMILNQIKKKYGVLEDQEFPESLVIELQPKT